MVDEFTHLRRALILAVIITYSKSFEVNEESSTDELLCRRCGHGVAAPKDFASVPSVKALRQRNDTILLQEKTLIQLFENPQGHKFEVLTARKASTKTVGEKFAEYSWFPGFFWTIVACPKCGFHLGWKFDPMDEAVLEIENNFSFFGLIFSHLIGSNFADSLLLTPKAYQS